MEECIFHHGFRGLQSCLPVRLSPSGYAPGGLDAASEAAWGRCWDLEATVTLEWEAPYNRKRDDLGFHGDPVCCGMPFARIGRLQGSGGRPLISC